MTISPQYTEYLRHFANTVPLRVLANRRDAASMIALRHDVDHDLDIALEMAHLEHRLGKKATYFVLHTAPYWQDPYLTDKLLQLQDYGHEVGLHVNVLTEWMRGEIEDPSARLHELLKPLRQAGVRITGMAAHGDPLCYESNYINYWAFLELRPENPAVSEDGRTAEGIYDPSGSRRVAYPHSHELRRGDITFPLWSVSMADLDITYDAWHLSTGRYFTDSGGSWKRTPDPLGVDLSSGRTQVLMHPIHWIGPPRTYFFLSPARSGSKWLTGVLNAATPLVARHEYMLNQEFHDGKLGHKRTGPEFARLADEERTAKSLIADAWTRREEIARDYAEVNVYLEAFAGALAEFFPDATMVMLQRDPKSVVRSILGRGWYDTPSDPRHRRVDVPEWEESGQFARACLYVADVYERLARICRHQIRLEKVSRDPAALKRTLERIGIAVHPRLLARVHREIVDATAMHRFPPRAAWTSEQIRTFDRICGPISRTLGYGTFASRLRVWLSRLLHRRAAVSGDASPPRPAEEIVIVSDTAPVDIQQWLISGFLTAQGRNGKTALVPDPARAGMHRHLVLGGSNWSGTAAKKRADKGWPYVQHSILAGRIAASTSSDGQIMLYALGFDAGGKLVHRPQLGILSGETASIDFSCRLRPDVTRFDVALYAPKSSKIGELEIESIRVTLRSVP